MSRSSQPTVKRRPLGSWLALAGLLSAAIGLLDSASTVAVLVGPVLATAGFALGHFSRGSLGRVHYLVPIAAWTFAICAFSDPEFRADAPGYYVYLRSAFFDGDLDFLNEAREWGYDDPGLTPTGLRENHYPVGPALVWSPFFLLAHGWVLLSGALGIGPGQAPTGFTSPYYRSTALGTLSVALVGAELLRRAMRGIFDERIASAAVVATVLLSPVLYYMFVVPTMAHALVFGIGGAAVWALRRCDTASSLRSWMALGAAIGLLTLVRWQAVLFALAAIPVAVGCVRRRELRWTWIAAGVATSIAVFSPQLVVWQILYGSPVTVPQGSGFFLGSPARAADVLIHAHHGFFVWTPGMVAASLGLVLALGPLRRLAVGGWLVFAATVALNGSLVDWHGSDSFGSRRFDVVLPFLAIGFAALFQACVRRPLVVIAAVVASLGAWNVGLITLKRRMIVTGGSSFEEVAAAQARLLYRTTERALDRAAGPAGRGLAYKVFVGQYLYRDLLLDGRLDLADADPRFLASGWSPPRGRRSARPFRLAHHPEACVRLPFQEPADLPAVLTARAPKAIVPQTMSITVNGWPVATRTLGDEWRRVEFTLPAARLWSGENSVCFRFSRRLPGPDGVAAAVATLQLP